LVPERETTDEPVRVREQIRGIRQVFADRLFWRVAPLSIITTGTAMAVQGLWAGPWLTDVANLTRDGVADRLLVMSASMTVGFIAWGIITDRLMRAGISLVVIIGGGVLLLIASFLPIVLQLAPESYLLWAVFGFLGNVAVLTFPLLSQHFGGRFAGRSNTALNLLVFGSAFSLQYALGGILDFWDAVDERYPAEAYLASFGTAFILIVLTFAWYLVPGGSGKPASERSAERASSPDATP
jgi:hypothetical protein